MSPSAHLFPYTARRDAFINLVGTFSLLLLLEGGIVVTLICLLAPNLLIKLLLLALFAALLLYLVCGALLTTLRTKHTLTETQLQLHFGSALKADIPRLALASAQQVHEKVGLLAPLTASYDPRQRRITAVFSDQGQILLRLKVPLELKVRRVSCFTESILINVDQPDMLLDMLGLADRQTMQATSDSSSRQQDDLTKTASPRERTSQPPQIGTAAIRVERLTRRFGDRMVVDSLTINIQPGEIYGFLGSNGAGKTTTIRMLVGLLEPSAGHVCIAGHDIWKAPIEARSHLGYVADRALLYERLTGRDFLSFLAQMRGIPLVEATPRIADLLALLELDEHADRLCSSYSFGMKRKLSLAGAMLHQPAVLILDEPLNGLDPRSARRLKDLFLKLAGEGVAIMLSTHDLATAETLCHRVGIIHKGRLLAEGNTTELRRMGGVPDLETVFLNLTEEGVAL